MPKMKKENISSPKLYHGTTEAIAKMSCIKGLTPYEVHPIDGGVPRRICASTPAGVCLTSSFPGLMAFETANPKERWGIIEVDVAHLVPDLLLPYEGFLAEKVKVKLTNEDDRIKKLAQIRQTLPNHRRKWRESLDQFGVCVLEGGIPLEAISRVVVYDPQFNPVMTKVIISTDMGSKFHQSNLPRQKMITRWLMGESVTLEEWLGSEVYSKMVHAERDHVWQVLRNKNGLDIFYTGTPNGKKISWW